MVTQSVSQCLLDHFPEDRFELVFVEGGGGPWDDPVDPVRLLETVHGSLCLASLVAGRPQPHQHRRHQPRLGTVVLDVASQGDLPRHQGWKYKVFRSNIQLSNISLGNFTLGFHQIIG